jgi:hypothetical protein
MRRRQGVRAFRPQRFDPAALRAGLKPHIREACTPNGILWRVFGLVPGESQCTGCGVVVEEQHYDAIPAFRCTGCGRPWPRRCVSKGCPAIVQPRKISSWRGQVDWDEPDPHCDACSTESVREHRESVLVRRKGGNPWGLPARLRADASTDYWNRPGRKRFDDLARIWMSSNLGREPGHLPVLYVYSSGPGTGKSTGAARCAVLAVSEGRARSMVWVREPELFVVMAMRGDSAPREDLLRRLYDCDLLVVDEVLRNGGAQYMTRDGQLSRVGEQLRDMWHVRFEDSRPTIFTSNSWCGDSTSSLWSQLFGEALASRFFGCARIVECEGPDMRRG